MTALSEASKDKAGVLKSSIVGRVHCCIGSTGQFVICRTCTVFLLGLSRDAIQAEKTPKSCCAMTSGLAQLCIV